MRPLNFQHHGRIEFIHDWVPKSFTMQVANAALAVSEHTKGYDVRMEHEQILQDT